MNDVKQTESSLDPVEYSTSRATARKVEYVSKDKYDALAARLEDAEGRNNDLVDELAAERFEKKQLAARVAELEAELAAVHLVMPPLPATGSGSMSTCGCSTWTDGLGNSGKRYCYLHRPKQPLADGAEHDK